MVLPFASPPPTFSLGRRSLEGHLYIIPPASARVSVGPTYQPPVATRGNSGLAYREVWTIWCALRTRYVQLLLGFVGTAGGFAGLVLPLSKCLVNRDSETDRVFLGEGISFIDRESL